MALTLEQRIARKSGIGGSDVAAIFGLPNPAKKTPLDIFFDKTDEEEPEVEVVNEDQEWGNLLEGAIRRKYELEIGKPVSVPPKHTHPKYEWMLGNVDGIDDEGVIAEFKNVHLGMAKYWGEQDTDDMPECYLYQCAHYRIVFDAPRVNLRALFGGSSYRKYTYHKNEKLEKLIIEGTRAFWYDYVKANVMPPFQTYDDVYGVYPISDPALVKTADSAMILAVQRLRDLGNESKRFDKEKYLIKKFIAAKMGSCEKLVDLDGNELLSWKSQSANRFDTAKFKELHPDLYKQFTRSSDSRVFRLKGEK